MKIILTLGAKGSIYADKNYRATQDIFKATVVDTTAAGDTFTGYFLTSYFAGDGVETALKTAAKAAAVTVSRKGASPSIPHKNEI